jgi:hypothetical protein
VARVRSAILTVVIVAAAFAGYLANGEFLGSYDSMPNSLLVQNAVATGRLDFDDFRNGYFTALGGAYAFVEAPNGHLTSVFPIGTAILTAPIELGFALARRADPSAPPLTSAANEPERQREEKIAAALVAALAVGLCWRCALLLGTPAQAAVATAVFAACTPMWAIASQALWQHGPVNLAVLALIDALLRADRSRGAAVAGWLAAAGLAAGVLPVIRPTALLFTLAAGAFVAWAHRARGGWFAGGLAVGIAPGVAWNLVFFHALAGGYGGNVALFGGNLATAAVAFAGLLISPNRGVFVFAPVLAFSLAGAVFAVRSRRRDAVLLAALGAACAGLVVVYAFFPTWWAGFTYGPRFLTDASAVAALLLIFVVPPDPLRAIRRSRATAALSAAFIVAAFASIVIEFAGANGGAAGSDWNAVPISIDLAPGRVWDAGDSQIRRNLLGAFYRFVPPPPPAPPAAPPAGASVVAFTRTPWPADPTAWSLIDARVANRGRAPLYGYLSGRYAGQFRLRVSLTGAHGEALSDQQLYVARTIAPGARGTATGLIRLPVPPLAYGIRCEPVVVGGTAVREAPSNAAMKC